MLVWNTSYLGRNRRTFVKVCALSSNLDGPDDDQIKCIEHGACQSLLPKLQAFHQEEEETDSFECTTVSEEEMAQEDVTHFIL